MSNSDLSETDSTASEEPLVKYHRLSGAIPELLHQDRISCLCASDKLLVFSYKASNSGGRHALWPHSYNRRLWE
jgi:hypothetical protein